MAILHSPSVGLEDMAKLTDLQDHSILENLKLRYDHDQIYTYIGSILAALNPYKALPSYYDKDVMLAYDKRHIGELPPHIYAIANDCYYSMWKRNDNQCVLISGESGAGKTESTKFILKFLSEMSQASSQAGVPQALTGSKLRVEEAILQSSPIMEAFGNAKTIYNNNSSRFGKFIQLQFSNEGSILGGTIQDYLLEKNRVVGQNPQERNYHIFYCLLAGTSPEQKKKLFLRDPTSYSYLNKSGCISDPTINDAENFQAVLEAFSVMRINSEQINDILSLLSAILTLGNVQFITAGGAQVKDMQPIQIVSALLNVDEYQLCDALTQKTRLLRGELISTPLDVDQAVNSVDSLAMNLYGRCFKWIIHRINRCIKGKEFFHSVGVLDIFGFENFEVNRFEQFNINFANEKLQEYFNKHIFSLEQHEYNAEGLEWVDIDWQDNGECLDLVERKLGILALINEESRFPKGTDETMLEKLHSNHAKNAFYIKPKVADSNFGIRHYAGEVFYHTKGFLEKNRDTFRDDILTVLKESRSDFIYDLFETMLQSKNLGDDKMMRKKPTVSSQFQESLHALMSSLNACNPYFVRCVKPNPYKAAAQFDAQLVVNQLRYSGMLETVKIRKAGFPVRRPFPDFVVRYRALVYREDQSQPPGRLCEQLLARLDDRKQLWQMGKTKVFLKESLETRLEKDLKQELGVLASKIKAHIKGYLARKRFKKILAQVVIVEKTMRMQHCRRRYLKVRSAVIVFQKYERARVARKILEHLKEEKRKEEERLREEQRQREEQERRELERLKAEEKMRELEELKRKLEEEARQRQVEEEAQRRLEEEQRQADLEKVRQLEIARKQEEEESRRKAEEQRLALEEEARKLAEEQEKLRMEEEERRLLEEVESHQQELDRLRAEQLERAERQIMHEFDHSIAQLAAQESHDFYSALEQVEDSEEDDENASKKSEDTHYFEGFLQMKTGGMVNSWKKRWFVLRDETLMWFKTKQEALKSGWLMKKGGGTGTLSRRNWRKRFFILKDTMLSYYESDGNNAKLLGKIDIKASRRITDSSYGRENSIDVETNDRTYHLVAESADDCSEWFSILTRVKNSQDYELKQMHDEEANPKNAIGSLDVAIIDSVVPVNIAERPNCFAIITAERVINLQSESPVGMNNWLAALTQYHKGKRTHKQEDILLGGWLTKESASTGTLARVSMGSRKKRYFVLTANSLEFYRSVELEQKMGAIALNSLCSVTLPDEKIFKEEACPPPTSNPSSPSPKKSRKKSPIQYISSPTQDSLSQNSLSHNGSTQSLNSLNFKSSTNSLVETLIRNKKKKRRGSLGNILSNGVMPTDTPTQSNGIKATPPSSPAQGQSNSNSMRRRSNSLVSTLMRSSKRLSRLDREGYWKFTVHGRNCSFNLYTVSYDEAWKWTYAIQDVIDSKPKLETPFQILIRDIKEAAMAGDLTSIERIFRLNPILRNTPHPLKAPLLPLPYGMIVSSSQEKGYTTLNDEGVKIFNSLLGSENLPDPMPVIQGILQTCHDLKPLRDEVYCQIIKQTTGVTDPDGLGNLRNWQILACLCCSFLPSRNILRYVRFHMKRQIELFPDTQTARYAEFALDSLKRTRTRDFAPSRSEVIAILGRREMSATVFCHGEGSCQININSATTAGQVVHTLVKGMGLDKCHNRFALYERSGHVEKAIEDRTVIADVIAKFERYKARGLSDRGKPWQLFFKLFCFLDTKNVSQGSIEYSFLYEEACEDVIRGFFPTTPEKLVYLAALRTQFIRGDYVQNDWIRDLSEVYPIDRLKTQPKKEETDYAGFPMKQRKENIISGTLRGLGEKTLKKLQKSASDDSILDSVYADEISATTTLVVDKWKTLKGMSPEKAQEAYMSVIQQWKYYGARLFEVESTDGRFPPNLWLAVSSSMVAVHKQGEASPIEEIPYEKILSFGAPIPNEYKIVVEGRRHELSFETNQVFEIAKLMKAYINEIVRKRQSVVSIQNGGIPYQGTGNILDPVTQDTYF
ncbi:unconventional myosin-X-like isoform X2 [Acanthaster planci]|uniref:Unconventional myosin-X-like isoform X2 n=1 Tax=Acanthaster planci TaxID=133434 RepID=A0A8B7XRW2_ACAPL|nr:unconventional myosin-X-like isoform X2 [Acanthaster planci]